MYKSFVEAKCHWKIITDRPECPMEAHVEKQGEHLNANSSTFNDSTIHLYNCFKILECYILLSKE